MILACRWLFWFGVVLDLDLINLVIVVLVVLVVGLLFVLRFWLHGVR